MTLLVRDEADILRANLDYHFRRGVDFVLATDNRSVDDTPEILREFERAGRLRYLFESADDYSQDLWVTRMARLAALDHGADWVFHVDADEFWWPERDRDLKAFFARQDPGLDGLLVSRSNFLPSTHAAGSEPFYRTMEVRQRNSTNALGRPLPGKIAHRGHPDVLVTQGNEGFTIGARAPRVAPVDEVLIFHFPMRSFAQLRRKVTLGGAAYARNRRFPPEVGITWRRLYELDRGGDLEEFYRGQVPNADFLSRGLADGSLVRDTRLKSYFDGPDRLASGP